MSTEPKSYNTNTNNNANNNIVGDSFLSSILLSCCCILFLCYISKLIYDNLTSKLTNDNLISKINENNGNGGNGENNGNSGNGENNGNSGNGGNGGNNNGITSSSSLTDLNNDVNMNSNIPSEITEDITSIEKQLVSNNDGSCSCELHCAKNWGGALPKSWNGAKCINAKWDKFGKEVDCNFTPGENNKLHCKCQKTNTSWLENGDKCDSNTEYITLKNNTDLISCNMLCKNSENNLPSDWNIGKCVSAYNISDGEEIDCNVRNKQNQTSYCVCNKIL